MTQSAPVPADPHADLIIGVKRVVEAAQIAAERHPNCGAFSSLNYALRMLPGEFRAQVGKIRPHEEDDQIDGQTEVARLTRENAELRRRLAVAEGKQLDLFAELAP